MIWHSAAADQVLEELGSNPYKGLSQAEADARLRKYGINTVKDKKRRTLGQIVLAELKSTTLIVVLVTAVVWLITSLLLQSGNHWGAMMIVALALVEFLVDVCKEARAASRLDALRNVAQPSATVLRNGEYISLPAAQLVPGDILVLEQGDYIGADARLIRCDQLRCDESAVTGEPVAVEKQTEEPLADIVPIEKRWNMVYAGSTVSHGTALGVVVATGMDTQAAKIASVVEDTLRIITPLQLQWKETAKRVGAFAAGVSGLVFVLGMILSDGSLFERFGNTVLTCVTLAAAAVPESLAATITAVLAVGVSRMVRHKMLITNLAAVETLSKVSVVCTDKTGTLTTDCMTMTRVFNGKTTLDLTQNGPVDAPTKNLLLMAAMCCDADVLTQDGRVQQVGDHTEAGIVQAAMQASDIDKATLDSMYPRLCLLPFDADRKLKTSVNMIDGKPVAVVKGAPDIILSRCSRCDPKAVTEAASAMADQALRVIGIAFKPLEEAPANPTQEELEYDLIFGGIVGLEDPPIPQIVDDILQAKAAGITVIMMTGDHVATAASTAKQLGILEQEDGIITNDQLDLLSDDELDLAIHRFRVYVRLSPENKCRVVEALQRTGAVVAMTGDRVEDAPALRQANVGCAMGQKGTDVARRAAHTVVTDNNFSTILHAISAGRGIYENIRKAILFSVGFGFALGLLMICGLLFFGQMPLTAVQIMLLNLIISVAVVLPLGLEPPANQGLLNQPPRTTDRLLDRSNLFFSAIQGFLVAVAACVAFGLGTKEQNGATLAFGTFAFAQLLCGFSSRSSYLLLNIKRHRFNLWLMVGAVLAIALIIAMLSVPALGGLFDLTAIQPGQPLLLAVVSVIPFVVMELLKLLPVTKK